MRADSRLRGSRAAALAALALLLQACQGLQFVDRGELEFTFPPDQSVVALPVRVTWDAEPLVEGQRYAVFVDRSPIPPGQTIEEALEPDDRGGIVLADGTEVVLDQLPIRGDVPERDRDRHDLTVVVLDADGRRLGEVADVLDLRVDRTRNG